MKRFALIALLAIAASACTIDVKLGIDLNPDGSGVMDVEIATDEEFLDLYRLTGREFEDLIATRGSEVGLAFTVVPGPVTRFTATSPRVSAQTLENMLEELAPGIGEVTISRNETTLEFDASLNPLTSIDDIAPYFSEPDSDPGQFTNDATVVVKLSIPGEVRSSTGSGSSGSELTFTVPFAESDSRLFATSMLEKESPTIPWVLILVVAIMLLALAFLLLVRSRLQDDDTHTTSPLRSTATPEPETKAAAPEDQEVGPESTPPEDQPVAPPVTANDG
ncbi:MAG: hypothetical protein ACR2OI_10650 [Acidimicrobiia bacterium]